MQTYKIYKGPERVTIELPEDVVILKRCSGAKLKGQPKYIIQERHYAVRDTENFGYLSTTPDGFYGKCRVCASTQKTSRTPFGPELLLEVGTKRCVGTVMRGQPKIQLTSPHILGVENFEHHKMTADRLRNQCRECRSIYKTSNTPFGPEISPDMKLCLGSEGLSDKHLELKSNFTELAKRIDGIGARCDTCHKHKTNHKVQHRNDRKRSLPNDGTTREQVYKDFNGVCFLCGEHVEWSDYHAEHVWPQSRGGGTVYENYRPSHARCNISKHDKSYFEIVIGWDGHWQNFTVDNLYLFNMCAQKRYEEIIKQAFAVKAVTNIKETK